MEQKVVDNYKEHKFHMNGLGFYDEHCSTCYSKQSKIKERQSSNTVDRGINDGWQERNSFDNYQSNYFN